MEPLRASLAICLFAVLVFVGSVTLTASVQSDVDALHSRQKRNILQMCHIMSLYTGRGCIDYNNYGCFCGHGNSGNNPVDAVDRCCQDHDRCYGRTGCWFTGVFVRYNYKCRYGSCICRDNRWYSPCKYNTCECDLQFARCLEWTYYNSSYSDYDRALCN